MFIGTQSSKTSPCGNHKGKKYSLVPIRKKLFCLMGKTRGERKSRNERKEDVERRERQGGERRESERREERVRTKSEERIGSKERERDQPEDMGPWGTINNIFKSFLKMQSAHTHKSLSSSFGRKKR